MALSYRNLDEKTRFFMLEEIRFDINRDCLYISGRLNEYGRQVYPALLIESARTGNDTDLADALRNGDCFNPTYQRKKPKGGYSQVQMPSNAPESLAEGEFNRFYIRALCRKVIDERAGALRVYRARPSTTPRPESERMVGTLVNAEALLSDLRQNIGIDTHLGVPQGPNSGLSVEAV